MFYYLIVPIFRYNKQHHCKDCYQHVLDNFKSLPKYSVIMAIESFELYVQNTSHLTIAAHCHKSEAKSTKEKKQKNNQTKQHSATGSNIYVNRNCFIIFNADLAHAGTAYDMHTSTCYRMHMYFLPYNDNSRMETHFGCDICMPMNIGKCDVCKNIMKLPKMRTLYSRELHLLLFQIFYSILHTIYFVFRI